MGYADQKFYARELNMVTESSQNFGSSTATASGAVITTTAAAKLKQYIRKTNIQNIRVAVDTASNVAQTTPTLVFLNGTSTFGVVTLGTGTSTAGNVVSGVMTSSNAAIAAGVAPTVNVLGTSTASNSGVANGSYTVYFEEQEMPS